MIRDKFFVDETMHGTRLDIAITKYLKKKYSRNQIKNFILDGCVQINDENCKPKDKLVSGDEIEFNFNDYHDSSWMPEKIDFNVIDETNDYIIVEKLENNNSSLRTVRIANGRNRCLEIMESKVDIPAQYFIMMDMDDVNEKPWKTDIICNYLNNFDNDILYYLLMHLFLYELCPKKEHPLFLYFSSLKIHSSKS